jgi:hypothetical protein
MILNVVGNPGHAAADGVTVNCIGIGVCVELFHTCAGMFPVPD